MESEEEWGGEDGAEVVQEVEGGVAEGGQEQGGVPPSGSSDSDEVDNNAQDCHGAFNVDADQVDMNVHISEEWQKEVFLPEAHILQGGVQLLQCGPRDVSRVWVQEADTAGIWHHTQAEQC